MRYKVSYYEIGNELIILFLIQRQVFELISTQRHNNTLCLNNNGRIHFMIFANVDN